MFRLTANFHLPSEDAPELSVEAIENAVRENYPHAIVDWERGRQIMADQVQRLIDMGCPEVLYRGHKALVDRTIFVTIPVDGTQSRLSGYMYGLTYYEGGTSLECEPFDINALKIGARRFASDLKLEFDLSVGDAGDLNLKIVPRSLTRQEMVAERFPGVEFPSLSFAPLDNWKVQLAAACNVSLRNHPHRKLAEKWLDEFGAADKLAESLIARVESIGAIHAASRVYFGDGQARSSMVIEYAEWTGILNLPGVPFPLLE